MTKVTNLLIYLLLSLPLFGQVGYDAADMNSCVGAINIFDDGDFKMTFNGGSDNLFEGYPSLSSIDSKNTLWCSFIAPSEGDVFFTASVNSGYVQMVVFEEQKGDICGEIERGSAEIKRLSLSKLNTTVGLSDKVDSSYLYKLHMQTGSKIYLMFATNEKAKNELTLNWKFRKEVLESATKVIDKRDDDFAATLSFTVRDRESGLPLIAGLTIQGLDDLEGLYTGSDFFFNISKHADLKVFCDLEGYFYHDSIYEVSGNEDVVINITMERVASGKSIHIEDIEFVPGTSEITKSSEPRLVRLKNFLALNSDIEIEIQGHVFAVGDNSFMAQKVSEARAKRVMKYLIQNGISKDRLSAVGYGNTRPVYAEPVRSYQEQANRRVEILVK